MTFDTDQLITLAIAMFVSGLVGFWIARGRYQGRSKPYRGHIPLPTKATMQHRR